MTTQRCPSCDHQMAASCKICTYCGANLNPYQTLPPAGFDFGTIPSANEARVESPDPDAPVQARRRTKRSSQAVRSRPDAGSPPRPDVPRPPSKRRPVAPRPAPAVEDAPVDEGHEPGPKRGLLGRIFGGSRDVGEQQQVGTAEQGVYPASAVTPTPQPASHPQPVESRQPQPRQTPAPYDPPDDDGGDFEHSAEMPRTPYTPEQIEHFEKMRRHFDQQVGQADGSQTVGLPEDVDYGKIIPDSPQYVLQIRDPKGRWHNYAAVYMKPLNVGRGKDSQEVPGLNTMAARHFQIRIKKKRLILEDLTSINGIFLKIDQPHELQDGSRFRIGSQILEFHTFDESETLPPEPLKSDEDGEVLWSQDLDPLAFLDLVRSDGRPGLRFPITKADATVLGREGREADLGLTGNIMASARHAQIERRDGRFFLSDLGSRNGTYVQLLQPHVLTPGTEFLAGQLLFRIIEERGI